MCCAAPIAVLFGDDLFDVAKPQHNNGGQWDEPRTDVQTERTMVGEQGFTHRVSLSVPDDDQHEDDQSDSEMMKSEITSATASKRAFRFRPSAE